MERNGLLEKGPTGLKQNRERNELEAKLQNLGLAIPWASSPSVERSKPK